MRQKFPAVFTAAAIAFVLILSATACGGIPESAAVVVNGHVITKDEVQTRINQLHKKMGPTVPDESQGAVFTNYRRDVTDKLVQEWLEQEETERRGITVSEDEISVRLQEIADDSYLGSMEHLLKQEAFDVGLTEQDIREQVRKDLLHEKLMQEIGKDVTVSDEDAQAFYEKNINQYVQPERRQVRQIITNSEGAASDAVRRIRSGESFLSLVEQVSVDPSAAQKRGTLGLISPGQLPAELDAVVFQLAAGQVSDPVKAGNQWYVLTVENIVPGIDNSFDSVRDKVKALDGNQLFAERYRAFARQLYESADKQYDPDYDIAGKVVADNPS